LIRIKSVGGGVILLTTFSILHPLSDLQHPTRMLAICKGSYASTQQSSAKSVVGLLTTKEKLGISTLKNVTRNRSLFKPFLRLLTGAD
jgi:hypothetical protein